MHKLVIAVLQLYPTTTHARSILAGEVNRILHRLN